MSNEIQIFVSDLAKKSRKTAFVVKRTSTVGDLKEMIKKKKKVEPDDQILTYNHYDLEDDDETLEDRDIRANSVLVLTRPGSAENTMEIVVDDDDGVRTYYVEPDITLIKFQKMIEKRCGVPPYDQILHLRDDDTHDITKKLEDWNMTLRQLGIKNGNQINMYDHATRLRG